MPKVEVEKRVEAVNPYDVFERMRDFGSYPTIASAVRHIEVEDVGDGTLLSRWEVTFRRGVMKWVERDEIDPENRAIRFQQLEGDLSDFSGDWRVTSSNGSVTIQFVAEFDLGIPTLAAMLDPVAEEALRENVTELIDAFCGA